MSTPSVNDVVRMRHGKAIQLCERLGIDCDEEGIVGDAFLCKKRCLEVIGQKETRGPVLEGVAEEFRLFEQKQSDFQLLLDAIREFVYDEEREFLLRALGVVDSDAWLSPQDFQAAKELCNKGQPMLLIAGAASSGKSTLSNALIGENLLPTDHNVTTASLCEIKYGPKKKATAHLETRAGAAGNVAITPSSVNLDLESEEGREAFSSWIFPKAPQSTTTCSKVEVFIPSKLFEHFTLTDSPGVNENDDLTPASRRLTQEYQENTACGFIYVIDATQPAEVGGQVGGLLAAMSRAQGAKVSLPADSALFVVNRWDEILKKGTTFSQDAYFDKLFKTLDRRWRGFKKSQVVTMDSRLAGLAHEYGVMTDDMQKLCKGISKILPRGMNNLLLKALKKPINLLDRIEQSVERVIREMKLPLEDRTSWQDDSSRRLRKFQTSLEEGEIANARRKWEETFDLITERLAEYLQNEESITRAVNLKSLDSSSQSLFDRHEVEELVLCRLTKEILSCTIVEKYSRQTERDVEEAVQREIRNLSNLRLEVFSPQPSLAEFAGATSGQNSGESEHNEGAFAAVASFFQRVSSGFLNLINSAFKGIVKLVRYRKDGNFRSEVTEAYRSTVMSLRSDMTALKDIVRKEVTHVSKTASIVFEDYPRIIRELEKELKLRRACQIESDLPEYRELLKKCHKCIGRASSYMLELGIEDYNEDDIDYTSSERKFPNAFGNVLQVDLGLKKKVSLKVIQDDIDHSNAEKFLRELVISRRLSGKDNHVMQFYGIARVQKMPLKLAFAFEWCGRSLGAAMLDESERFVPGQEDSRYHETKRILSEIFSGIAFVHEQNVVHRDLNPENIMLSDDEKKQVRIADLGVAKDLKQITGTVVGSPYYRAPEVRREAPYGTAADIYSIGVIMWELWHRKRAKHYYGMKIAGLPADFAEQGHPIRATKWKALMRKCWDESPSERPSAEEGKKKVHLIDT